MGTSHQRAWQVTKLICVAALLVAAVPGVASSAPAAPAGVEGLAEPALLDVLQKALAPDGATNDYFGYSVAISGDTAVIGAYGDDDNGSNSGSAYVFTRSGT
ncbi:MAG: FG-GAP repeat protein, partial [Coriobacteriia bacterium]|nr:FG-GAP repeat protein [Coriobacteriia bacterium]